MIPHIFVRLSLAPTDSSHDSLIVSSIYNYCAINLSQSLKIDHDLAPLCALPLPVHIRVPLNARSPLKYTASPQH